MPILKSSKKQMKQSLKKRVRNYRMRDRLKASIKTVETAVKSGKKVEAEKALQIGYKVIDLSMKKNLIHQNNAARKKSRLSRMLASLKEGVAIKDEASVKKGAKKNASKLKADKTGVAT